MGWNRIITEGLYVTKLSSTVSALEGPGGGDVGKKRYLYIDWYSPDVKDWCLKYAAIKLAVRIMLHVYRPC